MFTQSIKKSGEKEKWGSRRYRVIVHDAELQGEVSLPNYLIIMNDLPISIRYRIAQY